MTVWKIASRWSNDGNADSSVIHLFRKYQIVFVYNNTPDEKGSFYVDSKVQIGDLIALSDGQTIVAVGKVLEKPFPLPEKWTFDDDMINYSDDENIIGIKIKLIDLSENDRFYYGKIGRFHALHNENEQNIIKLWESQFIVEQQIKSFSINAKTCTLKYNNQNGKETILTNQTKYIIPIYQRPYSWTEDQIRKFLSDIFLSYWGITGYIIEDPMFIGTMQLSEKKFVDKQHNEQEIIDGQQRLTTFLILFKVLKGKFPDCNELKTITLDWLETRVNNGEQQLGLNELLNSDLLFNDETLNPYLKNAYLIAEIINEQINDEQNNKTNFDINRFSKYILSNIYFVVIETYAGLSKTLQIFNAINTTGLDLNAGDIFKIRMYEYLRDKKNYDEAAFNKISELYEKIERNNKQLNRAVTDIRGILNIYQYVLIAKYDLSSVLYDYGTETFFERLFDSLFNINQWDHFRNLKNLELDLSEIDSIIDIRYFWEILTYPTPEDACAINFIWWSRYSRYWILLFVLMFRFKDDENRDEKMFLFTRELSKLYSLYSVLFLKSISEIHSFTYSLTKAIISEPFDTIIEMIINKISSYTDYRGDNKKVLQNDLNGSIVDNAKIKNILCRLSAMLDENYTSTNQDEVKDIRQNIFYSEIDIEHIQSYNDSNGEKRKDILDEWKENINTIGNLMVLEQTINRSISNNPYDFKIKRYPESKFQIVKNHVSNFKEWDLDQCKRKKQSETDKIVKYIFG